MDDKADDDENNRDQEEDDDWREQPAPNRILQPDQRDDRLYQGRQRNRQGHAENQAGQREDHSNRPLGVTQAGKQDKQGDGEQPDQHEEKVISRTRKRTQKILLFRPSTSWIRDRGGDGLVPASCQDHQVLRGRFVPVPRRSHS